MNILEEADQVTSGDRNKFYGHPFHNHGLTAKFWDAYMKELSRRGKDLTARDVCWLNILQKCSRDMNMQKEDNEVDTAGYARNMQMIRDFGHIQRIQELNDGELVNEDFKI